MARAGFARDDDRGRDVAIVEIVSAVAAGRGDAARLLWGIYAPRLLAVVRAWYRRLPSATADEEDVVVDALYALWRECRAGAFDQRPSYLRLWRALRVFARRRFVSERRYSARLRRAGTVYLEDVEFEPVSHEAGLAAMSDRRYDLDVTIESLPKSLRRIAVLASGGWSRPEIAVELGISERTLRRKLAAIRHFGFWRAGER